MELCPCCGYKALNSRLGDGLGIRAICINCDSRIHKIALAGIHEHNDPSDGTSVHTGYCYIQGQCKECVLYGEKRWR